MLLDLARMPDRLSHSPRARCSSRLSRSRVRTAVANQLSRRHESQRLSEADRCPSLGAAGWPIQRPDVRVAPGARHRSPTHAQGFRAAATRLRPPPTNSPGTRHPTASTSAVSDGWFIPYNFDPLTMTASRIQPTGTGEGGLLISSHVEPQFSFRSAQHHLRGDARSDGTEHDYPVVHQLDFNTGQYTIL